MRTIAHQPNVIHRLAALLLVSGLCGCASAGADIHTESAVDAKANLSGYESYAWAGALELLADDEAQWKERDFDVSEELRFLIDRELKAKGLHFAAAEAEPDLLVAYMLVIDMDADETDLRERYGEHADLSNLHEGGLLIALVDSETAKPVWVGTATAQLLPDNTDEQARARLDTAVAKIFEGLKR